MWCWHIRGEGSGLPLHNGAVLPSTHPSPFPPTSTSHRLFVSLSFAHIATPLLPFHANSLESWHKRLLCFAFQIGICTLGLLSSITLHELFFFFFLQDLLKPCQVGLILIKIFRMHCTFVSHARPCEVIVLSYPTSNSAHRCLMNNMCLQSMKIHVLFCCFYQTAVLLVQQPTRSYKVSIFFLYIIL